MVIREIEVKNSFVCFSLLIIDSSLPGILCFLLDLPIRLKIFFQAIIFASPRTFVPLFGERTIVGVHSLFFGSGFECEIMAQHYRLKILIRPKNDFHFLVHIHLCYIEMIYYKYEVQPLTAFN